MNYSPSSRLSKLIAGTFLALGLASAAMADMVNLKSSDGTVNLVGDLVSFDGEIFIIRTDLGDLRIAANKVVCSGEGCPAVAAVATDVVIAGSETVGDGLMPLLMSGFATFMDAEVKTQTTATEGELIAGFVGEQGFGDPIGSYLVSSTTSDDAFAKLLDGSAQIGMASRRITPDEARALRDAGGGNMIDPNQEHILAVDSLVVIVNKDNPVDQLSLSDLGRIYSGELTNWSQVGGPDLAIKVVSAEEGNGTGSVFNDTVFGGNAPALPAGAVMAADNDGAAAAVAADAGAIAYVGYAFQRGQKAISLVSECGIGTSPDAFAVKTEEYSLFRRLYLYNRADISSDLAKQFIGFTDSEEAASVIRQAGFVDLAITEQDLGADSARAKRLKKDVEGANSYVGGIINNAVDRMANAKRLSATFRFRTGSSKLDPRGELDLIRLARYLETLPAGSKVTLVGFSDEVGEFEPNLALSNSRADQVAAELKALGGDKLSQITFETVGYGEISPAACNSSDAGRSINRRVETWISQG